MDRLSLHSVHCPWGRQKQEERAGGETLRASWVCVGLLPAGGQGIRVQGGKGWKGWGWSLGLWRGKPRTPRAVEGVWLSRAQPQLGPGASHHEVARPWGHVFDWPSLVPPVF